MKLEQMIGQLLLIGFQGTEPGSSEIQKLRQQISDGLLSGIIVFRHNIENPAQIANLLSDLKARDRDGSLLCVVDQEGGLVQRLSSKNGFPDFKSARELATGYSAEEAFEHYVQMAKVLSAAEINFNLAPCVDLDMQPECPVIGGCQRSYSSDPEIVQRYAGKMIEAMSSEKILSCLKHFPGHGSAQADSHKGLVDITDYWTESELVPFKGLIESSDIMAIMSAHLVHRAVHADLPATLCAAWTERLRTELCFSGVVVSDDLHMGAIQQYYSFEEVVRLGFNAGLDLFMFSNNPLAAQGVVNFKPDSELPLHFQQQVLQLIDSGELSVERVTQSFERVQALKAQIQ